MDSEMVMSRRVLLMPVAVVPCLVAVVMSGLSDNAIARPLAAAQATASQGAETPAATPTATSALAAQPDDSTAAGPVRLVQVTDIPMPRDSKVDEDASLVIGGGDRWLGRLVFKVRTNGAETYNYYFNGMVRLGWTRVTAVQSKVSSLVFSRGDRVVNLQIKGGLGGSTVTVIASTRELEGG
jgi:hypothetical protein